MGIFCEINLATPANGRYDYQPGSIVSGAIKYYLDEEYLFSSIILSLKGRGNLYYEDLIAKRRDRMYQYYNDEVYVEMHSIIHTNEKGEPLSIGQYEVPFSFQLPYDIPPSLEYTQDTLEQYVECKIEYYIRIKFERPGYFNLNKHFKKQLNVISGLTPSMTSQPLIYGEQKKLTQLSNLFSSKKSIVNLKATIVNSVLRPGEFVSVNYEIENSTKVTIRGVRVNLIEKDTFTFDCGESETIRSEVEGTDYTHDAIQAGETANFTTQIMIPNLCSSIGHSGMIARDYFVFTTVMLPMPHINMTLEIPFQVINALSSSFHDDAGLNASFAAFGMGTFTAQGTSDAPPTYWESMSEDTDEPISRKAAVESEEKEKVSLSSTSTTS